MAKKRLVVAQLSGVLHWRATLHWEQRLYGSVALAAALKLLRTRRPARGFVLHWVQPVAGEQAEQTLDTWLLSTAGRIGGWGAGRGREGKGEE